MTRSYDEMYIAALEQRQKMIDEGRDPKDGIFICSEREKLFILDKPPFINYELSASRDRICGLKIELIDGTSADGRAQK